MTQSPRFNIKFSPEKHEYYVNEMRTASFSEIINQIVFSECEKCRGIGCAYCSYTGRLNWWSEETADRGTWLHNRFYDIIRGELDTGWIISEFPEEIPVLLQMQKYIEETEISAKDCIIEKPFYSFELNTCGTPDIIIPRTKTGIEIKTGQRGSIETAHHFQVAAYANMVDEFEKAGGFKGHDLPAGTWKWWTVYFNEKDYTAIKRTELEKMAEIFKSFQTTWVWRERLTKNIK